MTVGPLQTAEIKDPLLSIRDLVVQFPVSGGTFDALRGVNLDVYTGQIVGLVGESGSGKTLTSLALMGLMPAGATIAHGSLTLDGSSIEWTDTSALRGDRVAMIFQNPLTSLNPVQRIGTQICEALLIHKRASNRKDARRKAVALLERVGVPDARNRLAAYPHEFSGGMLQRVMIAIGISCTPTLLIADEPTTALDVTVQAQVLQLFAELRDEFGMGLLIITHNLAVVSQIADQVAVMYAGRIIEQGPVRDVLAQPAHPYTRGLVGSVPRLHSQRTLTGIPGAPPDLSTGITGCSFAPRCEKSAEICQDDPESVELVDGHFVACWRPTTDESGDRS